LSATNGDTDSFGKKSRREFRVKQQLAMGGLIVTQLKKKD
jgi:hypothetical protein